jgi:hypothetical protein
LGKGPSGRLKISWGGSIIGVNLRGEG